MPPTGQRLEGDHAAGAGLDDRLEGDCELLAGDRRAQVGDQADPLCGHVVLVGTVERPVEAHTLGPIHRDVGLAHQRAGIRAVERRSRDAHARADPHVEPVEGEGLRQHLGESGRHGRGVTSHLWAAHEHRELVAAQPRQAVGVSQRTREPPRGLGEDGVAGLVAEPVVDGLEAVEVEQEQRHLLVVVTLAQGLLELVDEAGAVVEPGQGIPVGSRQQRLLGIPALADVLDLDVEVRLALVRHHHGGRADPHGGAIRARRRTLEDRGITLAAPELVHQALQVGAELVPRRPPGGPRRSIPAA